jgi:hypothetical protein
MLAVSLDCPFLIALSVFFAVYGKTKRVMNSIFEVYISHDNLHMIFTILTANTGKLYYLIKLC